VGATASVFASSLISWSSGAGKIKLLLVGASLSWGLGIFFFAIIIFGFFSCLGYHWRAKEP
jgi:hypothetical protein